MKIIESINEEVLEKAVGLARERNVILPTFAQQKDPSKIPPPIDPWPIRFATSFELREGREPVPPGHESFHDNWQDAGSFPLLRRFSKKRILARMFKVFGGFLLPVL